MQTSKVVLYQYQIYIWDILIYNISNKTIRYHMKYLIHNHSEPKLCRKENINCTALLLWVIDRKKLAFL